MKKLFFGITLIAISTTIKAQESAAINGDFTDLTRTNNAGLLFNPGDNTAKKYSGSPYLIEEWSEGTVVLGNEGKLERLLLILDLYKNDLILKKHPSNISLPKENIESFSLNVEGETKNFTKISLNDEIRFAEVLYTGELTTLIKIIDITFVPVTYDQTFKSANPNDEYRRSSKLYMLNDGIAEKIPSGKGGFVKLFPGHEDEIKDYIKTNQLDLTDEFHLRVLFEYINTLK
tara:strand:- start:962 stop:1657 length:696 start_codon:yes stop_codon:yes gene_type:complete